MRIRIIVVALLVGLSFAASADNYIINQAYEISVDKLQLPGNTVGNVSFKDCNACKTQVIRVTATTRYVLNNHDVPLPDFTNAANAITNGKSTIATVIHHLQSDAIVAIHITDTQGN